MSFKRMTTGVVKELHSHPTLKSLNNRSVTADGFRLLALQKKLLSRGFKDFIQLILSKVSDERLHKLDTVLHQNLDDEQGVDAQGNHHFDREHETYQQNYLGSLGLGEDIQSQTHLLPCVAMPSMAELENESSFSLLGSLLVLENLIPLEFRAIKNNRDHLFPEVFVMNDTDSEALKDEKAKAACYIDDHIIHDAKIHYPMLLSALDDYVHSSSLVKEVQRGIERMRASRLRFYNAINKAWVGSSSLVISCH